MTGFNTETAISILSIDAGDDEFVINFEDVWVWVGYSTKGHATQMLRKRFHEGVDYHITQARKSTEFGGLGDRTLTVMITKDCFKSFCLMAQTNKGDQVRLYFIEAEKRMRHLERELAFREQEQKLLAPWHEQRRIGASIQTQFQNACMAKKHPANHVHDLITKLITGKTAKEAREGDLVDGDPSIGLNYQPSPDQLDLINRVKESYIPYKRGTWQDQVYRAVFQVCPD
jgi:phage anti-repressor protein